MERDYIARRIQELEAVAAGGDAPEETAELEAALLKVAADLVEQADVNVKLVHRITEGRSILDKLDVEEDEVKSIIIAAVAGSDADPGRYSSIPLEDLLQLATERDRELTPSRDSKLQEPTAGSKAGPGIDPAFVSESAQAEIRGLEERKRALEQRIDTLKSDLDNAGAQSDEVAFLREEVHQAAEMFRNEKEARANVLADLADGNEQVEYLLGHIEKLLNHLKHEASAKVKAYTAAGRYDGDLEAVRSKNAVLAARNSTRERVITELKEGARVLEDQLRMMDEKYAELRTNLDATRTVSEKEVQKVQTKADRLRMKWMALQSFGSVPKELMDTAEDLKETAGRKF